MLATIDNTRRSTLLYIFILHTRHLSPAATIPSDCWLGVPCTESRSTAAARARLRRQTTFISADSDSDTAVGSFVISTSVPGTCGSKLIHSQEYQIQNICSIIWYWYKLNLLNRTVVCGVKVFFSKIWMSRHIDILQILWIYKVAASPVSMAGMARQLIDSRIWRKSKQVGQCRHWIYGL